MKNLLLVLTLLLAPVYSLSASTTGENSDVLTLLADSPYVTIGMERETVRALFGAPSAQLSAEVWVYFDCQLASAVATNGRKSGAAEKFNTLVVAFQQERVSAIRACESAPVRALLAAQSKRKSSAPAIAAK